MLRCFFWNLNRKDLTDVVGEAASTLRPDIFAFCEVGSTSATTLEKLNGSATYHFTTGRVGERFHIFTRFSNEYLGIRKEADRYLVLEVQIPSKDRFFLMVLHGPSKHAGWTPASLALEYSHYVSALRELQAEHELTKCIILGDFNLNPFDAGMIGASAFNAVMDARIARKETRRVQKREYGYFYNPMWNLMGDATPGPPASFFYDQFTQDELQWHMLDQVVVSPDLIDALDTNSLRILEEIGDISLITKAGRPDKSRFSDHLPLYFEMDL